VHLGVSIATPLLGVDAIYEGTSRLASDPISRLLPGCGNMGGFRMAGKGQDKQFVALFTTGQEKDWPDLIDLNAGQFTYYGDNRTPGHELHSTPLGVTGFLGACSICFTVLPRSGR